eukprot:9502243-Pyramimonas_sp.AAC.1
MVLTTGAKCNEKFSTMKALLLHAGRARRVRNEAALLTVTNQCFRCLQVLSTKENAERHVMRSFKRNICCRGRSSFLAQDVLIPSELQCPVCRHWAQSLFDLQGHIRTHCSLPQPEVRHRRQQDGSRLGGERGPDGPRCADRARQTEGIPWRGRWSK